MATGAKREWTWAEARSEGAQRQTEPNQLLKHDGVSCEACTAAASMNGERELSTIHHLERADGTVAAVRVYRGADCALCTGLVVESDGLGSQDGRGWSATSMSLCSIHERDLASGRISLDDQENLGRPHGPVDGRQNRESRRHPQR